MTPDPRALATVAAARRVAEVLSRDRVAHAVIGSVALARVIARIGR